MVNVTIFHHNFFQKEKTAIMMSLNHASYALSYFIFTMTVEGRCVHCPFYTNEKGRQRDYYETPSRSHRYKLLVCFSKPQAVRLLSPCCLYYKARSCKVVGQDNEEEAAWGMRLIMRPWAGVVPANLGSRTLQSGGYPATSFLTTRKPGPKEKHCGPLQPS